MSERFKGWENWDGGSGEIPNHFVGKDIPHGILPKDKVVLQHTDHWYNVERDRWEPIGNARCSLWGDDAFGPEIVVYGNLPRFSDAIHPERFPAKYGRSKPQKLSTWDGRENG